jgi:hypothetical protein
MSDTAPAAGFCSAATQIPPHTFIGGPENIKLLFDEELDSRRETQANQRAWEAVKLDQAQTASRRAQNAASLDKLLDSVNVLAIAAGQIATQAGQTEAQQTVSPAGTATSEAIKGAVGTAAAGEAISAEAVTANVANLMTSLVPVITSALATAISQTIAALVPVVVNASGGASTPSQTEPKG